MTTSNLTSAEELARSGSLRGKLSDVGLPAVLMYLEGAGKTGVLSLVSAGVRKAVYLKEGKVVFAASSQSQDRLGEVLLRGGKITTDEYLRLSQRIRGGQRLGKALVESGVLSPKDLWWAIERQVREIVWSLFAWEDGYFQFEENDRPSKEKITIDVPVDVLIVEGIRRIDGNGPIRAHFLPLDAVVERTDRPVPVTLEPHEAHVLDLVDGARTIEEICKESEIGEAESRKVLHTFVSVGVLRAKERKGSAGDADGEGAEELRRMIGLYNDMFRYLFRHMSDEVGPIAEIILEKYLNGLKEQRGTLFERVRLRQDGSLDPAQLEQNLAKLPAEARQLELVEGLNELLYAELLAVKRTLGASHESRLIQVFQKMREQSR